MFLDRDGTLVEEVPYLHDPGGWSSWVGWPPLARLAEAGYALVVVTNQAGVARGLYDEAAVAAVHRRLAELLAGAGCAWTPSCTAPTTPTGRCPASPAPAAAASPGRGCWRRPPSA